MAARVGNITFDFWSAVLGRPLDKGSSELFASLGGADAARQEPAWYFNRVPESKAGRQRVLHRSQELHRVGLSQFRPVLLVVVAR
jgi:hypothetical protein